MFCNEVKYCMLQNMSVLDHKKFYYPILIVLILICLVNIVTINTIMDIAGKSTASPEWGQKNLLMGEQQCWIEGTVLGFAKNWQWVHIYCVYIAPIQSTLALFLLLFPGGVRYEDDSSTEMILVILRVIAAFLIGISYIIPSMMTPLFGVNGAAKRVHPVTGEDGKTVWKECTESRCDDEQNAFCFFPKWLAYNEAAAESGGTLFSGILLLTVGLLIGSILAIILGFPKSAEYIKSIRKTKLARSRAALSSAESAELIE